MPDFSGGINVDCLSTIWRTLNETNSAAGGTSSLLAKRCKDALDGTGCNETWGSADIAAAVALAKTADQLIVVVSNAEDEGGEGQDRSSIALAPDQMAMARAVFAAVSGLPRVRATLMLINGGVVAFDELREEAPSILELFMPGAYGPQAVAETVWGQNVPSGKMPSTLYFANYTHGLDIDDMSMQAGSGRTYRYFSGPVLYPFAHGISYTTFSLSWSPPPPPAAAVYVAAEDLTAHKVVVTNTGDTFAADEVVLLFMRPKRDTIPSLRGTPVVLKQLIGFEKVHLAPGASRTVSFTVPAASLGLVDADGHTSLHPGAYELVFSRGCVGCAELVAPAAVERARPLRLKTFRRWW